MRILNLLTKINYPNKQNEHIIIYTHTHHVNALTFGGLLTRNLPGSRTTHYWCFPLKSAHFRVRDSIFGVTKNRGTLVDRLTSVTVVGFGDHLAQLV